MASVEGSAALSLDSVSREEAEIVAARVLREMARESSRRHRNVVTATREKSQLVHLAIKLEGFASEARDAVQTPPEALVEIQRLRLALLAVFVDPLTNHGARALVRETLGIPFIPWATPEEMLRAYKEAESNG